MVLEKTKIQSSFGTWVYLRENVHLCKIYMFSAKTTGFCRFSRKARRCTRQRNTRSLSFTFRN